MSRAVAVPHLRDLGRCLTGVAQAAHELTEVRGVAIVYAQLPGEELGDWNSATRTLQIAVDATVEDRLWLLVDLWLLLVIGPSATSGAHRAPLLHLVPTPRATGDS